MEAATPETGSSITKTKPFGANANDEYELVRESSNDFVSLRKMLIMSPVLNGGSRKASSPTNDELSFEGSVFQTLLDEKRGESSTKLPTSREIGDKAASLVHEVELGDSNTLAAMYSHQSTRIEPNKIGGESWSGFNALLLRYLNNYMRQVKDYEVRSNKYDRLGASYRQLRDVKQQEGPAKADSSLPQPNSILGPTGSRSLLTFACLAQDANPMSNLTFDWLFGSTKLANTDGNFGSDLDPSSKISRTLVGQEMPLYESNSSKPLLVYDNENFTIHVTLVRRHDTGSSLNPFKMSLLTVNVIVLPLGKSPMGSNLGSSSSSPKSLESGVPIDYSGSSGSQNIPKTPMIKSRHQPRATGQFDANSGVQFANDYGSEIRPIAHDNRDSLVQLNERNLLEQIDQSLKCTVTNQIGTSEVCHVRVNTAERLKTRQAASSEFANWRMPSLGHKSLLIICIFVGCGLVVFLASALFVSPYLRSLSMRKESTVNLGDRQQPRQKLTKHDNNNTGQSSCSQKSSMLGLLSNNGDSSLQGSSDDDSSARLNHLDANNGLSSHRDGLGLPLAVNHQPHGSTQDRNIEAQHELNYDHPRAVKCSSTLDPKPDTMYSCQPAQPTNSVGTAKRVNQKSARIALWRNLSFKSLNKFKVDRISDISNFASRMDNLIGLYSKTDSSPATNATGLDFETSVKKASPASKESSTFLATSARTRPTIGGGSKGKEHPDDAVYLYNQNGLQCEPEPQMMQLSSQMLSSSAHMQTYSNLMNYQSRTDPLDEFIRQREVDPPVDYESQAAPFSRSQSNRNQLSSKPTHQFYPALVNRGPPVYPRTQNLYGPSIGPVPPVSARICYHQTPHTASIGLTNYSTTPNNRLSVPHYSQSYDIGEFTPMPISNYRDTIDSHLNRMADNVAFSSYSNRNVYDGVNNQSNEHIYAVNAYATPEQTPIRRRNSLSQTKPSGSERPSVSQLVKTFSSQAPN